MIKKISKIFVFCVLSFLLPGKIYALCDNSELAGLKELASNINVSYKYKIQNSDATFDISFDNVFSKMYLQDKNGNKYYSNVIEKNNQIVFYNYPDNKNYSFDVYVNGGECNGQYLHTIYATTPKYNPFYTFSVCDDAKEYKLCQRWTKHSLTSSEFKKNVQNYIAERDKITEIEKKDETAISYILDFVRNYYMYIIIGIVLIIVVIKFIRYKKDSFGF